jgi:hypothetical protein
MEGVQPEEKKGDGYSPGGVAGREGELVDAVGHHHVLLVHLEE